MIAIYNLCLLPIAINQFCYDLCVYITVYPQVISIISCDLQIYK